GDAGLGVGAADGLVLAFAGLVDDLPAAKGSRRATKEFDQERVDGTRSLAGAGDEEGWCAGGKAEKLAAVGGIAWCRGGGADDRGDALPREGLDRRRRNDPAGVTGDPAVGLAGNSVHVDQQDWDAFDPRCLDNRRGHEPAHGDDADLVAGATPLADDAAGGADGGGPRPDESKERPRPHAEGLRGHGTELNALAGEDPRIQRPA